MLVLIGLLAIGHAVQLGVFAGGQPGPGLFPLVAGLLIVTGGGFLLATRPRETPLNAEFVFNRATLRTLLSIIAVMAAWILAMPYAGYVLVTFLAVCLLARLFGLTRTSSILLLGLFTSLAIYVMFDWLLFLDLPRGPWSAD